MSTKKRPKAVPQKIPQPLPVLHGDAFRSFIDEATSIGNEVTARRQFDADVTEYLKQKGQTDEFKAWLAERQASRAR